MVVVNSREYSGDATNPLLDGVEASSMSWYTDATVVNYGFKICLTAAFAAATLSAATLTAAALAAAFPSRSLSHTPRCYWVAELGHECRYARGHGTARSLF